LRTYRKVFDEEIEKLKTVLVKDEVDMDAVIKSYERILTAAKNVCPGWKKGFFFLDSWTEGSLPKFILRKLDYNSSRYFAFTMAKHFADTGDTFNMDYAFELVVKWSDVNRDYVDKSLITKFRQYGYGKKVEAGLERIDELLRAREGDDKKDWFTQATGELGGIQHNLYIKVIGKVAGPGNYLFSGGSAVVFLDRDGPVTVDGVEDRVVILKRSICLERAGEILEEAKQSNSDVELKLAISKIRKMIDYDFNMKNDKHLNDKIEELIAEYR